MSDSEDEFEGSLETDENSSDNFTKIQKVSENFHELNFNHVGPKSET